MRIPREVSSDDTTKLIVEVVTEAIAEALSEDPPSGVFIFDTYQDCGKEDVLHLEVAGRRFALELVEIK